MTFQFQTWETKGEGTVTLSSPICVAKANKDTFPREFLSAKKIHRQIEVKGGREENCGCAAGQRD